MTRSPLAALTPRQRAALRARQTDPRAVALLDGRAPAAPRPAPRQATPAVTSSARSEAA